MKCIGGVPTWNMAPFIGGSFEVNSFEWLSDPVGSEFKVESATIAAVEYTDVSTDRVAERFTSGKVVQRPCVPRVVLSADSRFSKDTNGVELITFKDPGKFAAGWQGTDACKAWTIVEAVEEDEAVSFVIELSDIISCLGSSESCCKTWILSSFHLYFF